MAQDNSKRTEPASIRIKLPQGEVEVKGRAARLCAFFAEHEAFFNDERILGNVMLSFKEKDVIIKQEVAAQF